jgi:hypothetical protein
MVAASGSTLDGLEWFDSGKAGQNDGQFTYYNDGVQGADGVTFKNTFYDLLNSSYLSASDPYKLKYVVSFDPPAGVTAEQEVHRAMSAPPILFKKSPGVIGPDERMSADLARERVWDAILLSYIPRSRVIWPAIAGGTAGPAWRVSGIGRRGEPWNYFIVPLMSEQGEITGLVQMSDEDGAFQQVRVPLKPYSSYGVAPEDADAIALSATNDDYTLWGGDLTWDSALDEPLSGSPLLPYYSYYVFGSEGQYCGQLLVMLRDGEISLHRSFEVGGAVCNVLK